MARMYDTSRMPNEFSLSKLSEIYHNDILNTRNYYLSYFRKQKANDRNFLEKLDKYESYNNGVLTKTDMKVLFSYKKTLKTGEEGKTLIMPNVEELHTTPKFIENWVKYSVLDAEVTYYLRDALQLLLKTLPANTKTHENPVDYFKTNYDLYLNFWRNFGELMTDMEREGIKINVEYLRVILKI